jgi:hypothetical protein
VATLVLVGASLSVVFSLIGLYRRAHRGQRITRAYTLELVFDAIQLGATLAGGVLPIVWLLVSTAKSGGPIERNLPPGMQEEALLGILVVGGATTLVYTIFNYRKHL